MLRFALVDGVRRSPFQNGRGICPTCSGRVIAKCGRFKVHHWAHESNEDCDSWSESVGPWHLGWQNLALEKFVEVTIERHRADILGCNDIVVELQHSPIRPDDIEEREAFYGKMVWLFDATYRFGAIRSGNRAFFSLGKTKHLAACSKDILLDFGRFVIQVESLTDELSQFSGFGLVRDREWIARTYLADRKREDASPPPVAAEKNSCPWQTKKPWKSTKYPSRWSEGGTEQLVPKGTVYIPLNYEWVKRRENRRWSVWSGVISRHPELANGWTESDLREMLGFLKGEPMILNGVLRLMPSPADEIPVSVSKALASLLLEKASKHAEAGRIPVLKDETRRALLQRADDFETSNFGPRRGPVAPNAREDDYPLFD